MKLHLPIPLLTALLGIATLHPVFGSEVISVNAGYNPIPQDATGEVGGVTASGWMNITGYESTDISGLHALTTQSGDSAGTLSLTTYTDPFRNGRLGDQTVSSSVLSSYLDIPSGNTLAVTGVQQWHTDIQTDFLVSSIAIYVGEFPDYTPLIVNGVLYIGGTDNAVSSDVGWGEYAGATLDERNTVIVTGNLGGTYTIANKDNSQLYRSRMAGFQITDVTDSVLWSADVNGSVEAADLTYSLGSSSRTLDTLSDSERILGYSGSGKLDFSTAGVPITAVQINENSHIEITGDGARLGLLFVENGASLHLGVTLQDGTDLKLCDGASATIDAPNTLGTLTNGGTLTINADTQAAEYALLSSGSLLVKTGTALTIEHVEEYDIFSALVETEGYEGFVRLQGNQVIGSRVGDDASHIQGNYEVDGNLTWGVHEEYFYDYRHHSQLSQKGEVKVNGEFAIGLNQSLTISGGKLEAETIVLGQLGSATIQVRPRHLEMTSGSITTGFIYLENPCNDEDAFLMTGGTLKFTQNAESAFKVRHISPSHRQGDISLLGGTLKAEASSWYVDDAVTLGNVRVETLNGTDISFTGNTLLEGTITNAGNLRLEGVLSANGLQYFVPDTLSYTDGQDSQNGFATGSFWLVRQEGDTATLDLSASTLSIGSRTYAISQNAEGAFVTMPGEQDIYYVNTGELEYSGAMAADSTQGIVMQGGTLNIHSDLNENLTDGIMVAKDSTLRLHGGSFDDSSVHYTTHACLTLQGDGTYYIGSQTLDITHGLRVGDDWTGTVSLEGTRLKDIDLSHLGNAQSTITLSGVQGYLGRGDTLTGNEAQVYDFNLVLENGAYNYALSITDSYYGDVHIFRGNVSGSGTLTNTRTRHTLIFAGDVSQWTGKIVSQTSSGHPVCSIIFSDKATDIGVDIKSSYGTYLVFRNDEDIHISGCVSGRSNVLFEGKGNKTLAGESSYLGYNYIMGGSVTVANSRAFGTSEVHVMNGTTLAFAPGHTHLDLGSNSLYLYDGSTLDLSANPNTPITFTGSLVIYNTLAPLTLKLDGWEFKPLATEAAKSNSNTSTIELTIFDSQDGVTIEDWNNIAITGLKYGAEAQDVEMVLENGALILRMNVITGLMASWLQGEADNPNSQAGVALLGGYDTLNATTPGIDTDAVLNALSEYMQDGNPGAANNLLAAVAGAGTSVLGMAFAEDVERQLRAVRNRVVGASGRCGRKPGEPVFNAWINGEGDYHKIDADGYLPGYTLSSWGGTVGFEADCGNGLAGGLAFTAMYGDLEAKSADLAKGDMDRYYLSAFVCVKNDRWAHTFVGTLGHMDASLNRTVNYGNGCYRTRGNTDGLGLGLLYEVGYNIPMDEDGHFSLQPIANVAWRHVDVNGYVESGSDAALRVADQSYDAVTFGLGCRARAIVGERTYNRALVMEGRALFKVDAGDRAGNAAVSMLHGGTSTSAVESAERGAVGVELGLGITVPTSPAAAVFFDASIELRADYHNANATVGYRVDF